ncbi:MAG: DUF4960 domain-containing protein, partial [Muribaculaceae bacterium]|nr:DUF4960 domain-containing protein [Muribaculaceae bacterium]
MKTLNNIYCSLLGALIFVAGACSDDNTSDLRLDGDTRVEAITVNGYDGDIDHTAKAISLSVATDINLAALTVEAITLRPGATGASPSGTRFDGSVPRAIHVTNGDVYSDYTITVKHDNVEFTSFIINGEYSGTIDNNARTILVFVPLDADPTAMQATFTVNDGTIVTPESGSLLDFSLPVVFTAVNRTATVEYTVTVIRDEMSQAPKAFIGNAASVDTLGNEAAAACRWMLDNVPNSRYVAIQEIIDGSVLLDDFKMVWCHFDWLDWPGQLWASRA